MLYLLFTPAAVCPQVYQRQIMKADLAGATMEAGGRNASMSHSELKQLFGLDTGSGCATKQLLDSCSAGQSVEWLKLPGSDSDSNSSSSSLPGVLVAAVRAEAITAVNREKQPGELAREASEAEEAAGTCGTEEQLEQQQSTTKIAGPLDDVHELEVDSEDDD